MYDNRFSILIETFKSLPNITTKQAKKILFFLINSDEKFIDDFVNRISIIKKSIHICKYCGNISFDDNICNICSNSNRDKKKTYIVSTIEDLEKIEDTNLYKGTYFVLNEEINIKNNKKLNQNLVKKISNFISTNNVEEITIATDWTINGEATAFFLKKIFMQLDPKINIFRLAVGLPINSAVNYADNDTIKQAIINKTKY